MLLNNEEQEKFDQTFITLKILNFALISSVFIHWFVAAQLVTGEPKDEISTLGTFFVVIGLIIIFIAMAVEKKMIEALKSPTEPIEFDNAIKTISMATIIGLVLREVPAIFGLVVAITDSNLTLTAGLCLMSIISMTLAFPKRERLLTVLDIRS